jgi:hypothetical protein
MSSTGCASSVARRPRRGQAAEALKRVRLGGLGERKPIPVKHVMAKLD